MALSRRRKIIIGVVVAVVLTMITAISLLASRRDTPEVTTVKLDTRPELRSTVTASGEVRPVQYVNMTSEVEGRIIDIYVKEGDIVKKGQSLVKLDPTQIEFSKDAQAAAFEAARDDLRASQTQILAAQNQLAQTQQGYNAALAQVDTARTAVDTARQQVAAAETDVDRAQVQLNIARREVKRNTELLESQVISRLEFDQAKDNVDTAEVAVRTAKANLETRKLAIVDAQKRVTEAIARARQQEAAVRDGRRAVETANLTASSTQSRLEQQNAVLRGQQDRRDRTLQAATISGIVAEIPSKVGTFAIANFQSTPLMTIADMSTVNVEVKVDETEIDKVEVGQRAKIKVDAFGDREIEGEVTQKTPLAVGKSQTSGGLSNQINVQEAKEFRVVIQLKNLSQDVQEGLRPGMSATATITTKTANNVVAVPLQAIIDKQPENQGQAGSASNNSTSPADKPKPIKGVYILDGNKAKFVEITTGITGESDIEVLSGLSAGAEVITGPSRVLKTLKEGDAVKKQTKPASVENANK